MIEKILFILHVVNGVYVIFHNVDIVELRLFDYE